MDNWDQPVVLDASSRWQMSCQLELTYPAQDLWDRDNEVLVEQYSQEGDSSNLLRLENIMHYSR